MFFAQQGQHFIDLAPVEEVRAEINRSWLRRVGGWQRVPR